MPKAESNDNNQAALHKEFTMPASLAVLDPFGWEISATGSSTELRNIRPIFVYRPGVQLLVRGTIGFEYELDGGLHKRIN